MSRSEFLLLHLRLLSSELLLLHSRKLEWFLVSGSHCETGRAQTPVDVRLSPTCLTNRGQYCVSSCRVYRRKGRSEWRWDRRGGRLATLKDGLEFWQSLKG